MKKPGDRRKMFRTMTCCFRTWSAPSQAPSLGWYIFLLTTDSGVEGEGKAILCTYPKVSVKNRLLNSSTQSISCSSLQQCYWASVWCRTVRTSKRRWLNSTGRHREVNRHTDRQTDRQTEVRKNRQTDGPIDRRTHGQKDRPMDGRMNWCTDGQTDGRTDGHTDR